MKTADEIRDWVKDLRGYTSATIEQSIGVSASIASLEWVLGDEAIIRQPEGLCGVVSCVYLPDHAGLHSWEVA